MFIFLYGTFVFKIANTKEELINPLFHFNESNELVVKMPGYKQLTFHSYKDEWTEEERNKDAIKFIVSLITRDQVWPKIKLFAKM